MTNTQKDNMKTVYPQQTQFAGGYNNWHNFAFINMSYSLKSGTLAQILKKKNNNRFLKKKSVLLKLVSVLSLQFWYSAPLGFQRRL